MAAANSFRAAFLSTETLTSSTMSLPTRPRRSALYLPGVNTGANAWCASTRWIRPGAWAWVDGALIENLHAREAERLLALAAAISAKSNLQPQHP